MLRDGSSFVHTDHIYRFYHRLDFHQTVQTLSGEFRCAIMVAVFGFNCYYACPGTVDNRAYRCRKSWIKHWRRTWFNEGYRTDRCDGSIGHQTVQISGLYQSISDNPYYTDIGHL